MVHNLEIIVIGLTSFLLSISILGIVGMAIWELTGPVTGPDGKGKILCSILLFLFMLGVPLYFAYDLAFKGNYIDSVRKVWLATSIVALIILAQKKVRQFVTENDIAKPILISVLSTMISYMLLFFVGVRESSELYSFGIGFLSFSVSIFNA